MPSWIARRRRRWIGTRNSFPMWKESTGWRRIPRLTRWAPRPRRLAPFLVVFGPSASARPIVSLLSRRNVFPTPSLLTRPLVAGRDSREPMRGGGRSTSTNHDSMNNHLLTNERANGLGDPIFPSISFHNFDLDAGRHYCPANPLPSPPKLVLAKKSPSCHYLDLSI